MKKMKKMKKMAKTRSPMIEPGDLSRIIEELGEECVQARRMMNDSCLARQIKEERHSFFDGYESALRNFCWKMRKLRGINDENEV